MSAELVRRHACKSAEVDRTVCWISTVVELLHGPNTPVGDSCIQSDNNQGHLVLMNKTCHLEKSTFDRVKASCAATVSF